VCFCCAFFLCVFACVYCRMFLCVSGVFVTVLCVYQPCEDLGWFSFCNNFVSVLGGFMV